MNANETTILLCASDCQEGPRNIQQEIVMDGPTMDSRDPNPYLCYQIKHEFATDYTLPRTFIGQVRISFLW